MPTKTVKLEDFSKHLDKFSGAHIDFIREAVARGVERAVPDLVMASPVDTGQYANSWDTFISENSVSIGNYAPHAPIIEFGARPFTPPLKPLLQWAKRVLQDPSQPPDYSPEVWSLAVYTRNKIEKYGQAPKHIMSKHIPKIIEYIDKELENGI